MLALMNNLSVIINISDKITHPRPPPAASKQASDGAVLTHNLSSEVLVKAITGRQKASKPTSPPRVCTQQSLPLPPLLIPNSKW